MSELANFKGAEILKWEEDYLVYKVPYANNETVIVSENVNGHTRKEYEDGAYSVTDPTGKSTTYFRDGTTVIEYVDGNAISIPLD